MNIVFPHLRPLRGKSTYGHMGHAFWTCPLKVAGVGMGSPRLARIIAFLGCTQ